MESFAKLYLFPGVAHCSGRLGPDTFDVLTPVMAWVETGTPPGAVVASKMEGTDAVRTRPVFPCLAVARYAGADNMDDAANFVATTPQMELRVGHRWVGASLCSSAYQATCRAEGTQLVCRPPGLTLGGKQPRSSPGRR